MHSKSPWNARPGRLDTPRVKDCLEEEMAVLKEFREKVERKRRCGKGAILAKEPPGCRPRMSLKTGKRSGRRVS